MAEPAPVSPGNELLSAAEDASADARAAAHRAAGTQTAAVVAAEASSELAERAKVATALAVAAAASAAAEIASWAADDVQAEATSRALRVAADAVEAMKKVAAEMPADGDHDAAQSTAAAVAATVQAQAVAEADATAAAATTVALAVAVAAKDAARVASDRAASVELEVAAAAVSAHTVTAATATTAVATDVTAASTRRVADLAAQLRVVTALRDSERRFRVMFEHAPVGMMLVTLGGVEPGRVLRVNPALRELTGRSEAQLLTMNGHDLLPADDRVAEGQRFAALLSGQAHDYECLSQWRHADGRDLWVRMSLYAIREDDTPVAYAVGQVEDVTQRQRAEAALRVREETFRLAFDNVRVGMMFLSLDGALTRANNAMLLLLGHTEPELLGRDLESLADPQDRADIGIGITRLIGGAIGMYQAERRFQHVDGRVVWGLLSGSVVQDKDSRPSYLVFQVEDITGRKQAEVDLEHRALHDVLTGLPNRLLLIDHLAQACSRAERTGTFLAVLFLDVDDFKEVNDSLGHEAGDEVLIEVAARLRGVLRATDTAARLGGDEFVIVCEALGTATAAGVVADHVDRALAAPLTVGVTQVQVTASIGIATTSGGASPEDLLRDADTAMYRAKVNGKGRYEFYDPAMRVGVLRQLTVAGELSRALAREELRLHYQPTYDLRSGVIVGVEALLRWEHPGRGLLAPGEFLDVAEGRRLMIPIGDWVVATAAGQAAAWVRAFGARAPDMWVNVSAQQLGERHLTAVVEQVLADSGLGSAKLGLEITERQLIGGADSVRADLVALRELGLRLAVDDFGTGFASLDYLRRFPFDVIKIDQSFVSGLGHDRVDTAVTSSVVALASSLELEVVAEGVETREQYLMLRDLGCDLGQGYLMHRPAPAEAIDRLLQDAVAFD